MRIEQTRGSAEKPEPRQKYTEEEKKQVRELLNDPKIRKELLTRRSAPYTEEQLVQAENYLNGKDSSREAHHQFGRLCLDAKFLSDESEEHPTDSDDDARSIPPKSGRKPSLDDYDRMMG